MDWSEHLPTLITAAIALASLGVNWIQLVKNQTLERDRIGLEHTKLEYDAKRTALSEVIAALHSSAMAIRGLGSTIDSIGQTNLEKNLSNPESPIFANAVAATMQIPAAARDAIGRNRLYLSREVMTAINTYTADVLDKLDLGDVRACVEETRPVVAHHLDAVVEAARISMGYASDTVVATAVSKASWVRSTS